MTMTKRDFESLAEAVRISTRHLNGKEYCHKGTLLEELCSYLLTVNPSFDSEKFRDHAATMDV